MDSQNARGIAKNVGLWPLFADSREGLKRLIKAAPCAAIINSDRSHGIQVQNQLGFNLSYWLCAEDSQVYKPNPKFWEFVSAKCNRPFSRAWWHVSAYGDYDLNVARDLGLTCIFIPRPHSRPGFAHIEARDLIELADLALRA